MKAYQYDFLFIQLMTNLYLFFSLSQFFLFESSTLDFISQNVKQHLWCIALLQESGSTYQKEVEVNFY